MNLIKNEENEINYSKNNEITKLLKLIETISNYYILKYKYIFFDSLLKEWYEISKNIIKEKENDLKNINSIYIYNCHKNIFYIIKSIFNKNRIANWFDFIYNFKNIRYKRLKIIEINQNEKSKNMIKRIYWNIFIYKIIINNNSFYEQLKESIIAPFDNNKNKNKIIIKKIFMDIFIYRNIKILGKENCICKLNIRNKNRHFYLKEEVIQNYLWVYYTKWKINIIKNSEQLFDFYFKKIRFFQCNNIIYIYKRKLRLIYNIFINNYKNYYSTKFNKNEIYKIFNNKTSSLLIPLNKLFNNRKAIAFGHFVSFYYSITKNILLSYSILHFSNKYFVKIKKNVIHNLELYDSKKKNNSIHIFMILSKIFSFNKYKTISYGFYLLKNKISDKPYSNNSEYLIQSNKFIRTRAIIIKYYKCKNPKNIIKILLLYNKYRTLKKMKIPKGYKEYFIKWKIITKKSLYNDFIQNKNIINKKIHDYTEKNKRIQNKLLKIKKIIDKKKKKNEIKEKINKKNRIINVKKYFNNHTIKGKKINKENLKEKIMISENKIIDSKEFDKYFDELPLNYLENLENLKNKNEPIISNLQTQINNLINEIDNLSNDI